MSARLSRDGGEPKRLFRETTKAWVNDPGAPKFLKDGSFLLASERTGWKHLYHFAKDGKLLGAGDQRRLGSPHAARRR